MLYKTKQHQKMNKTKEKPKLNKKDLLQDVKHISVWIVREHGEKDTSSNDKHVYVFKITKKEFQENFEKWLNEYQQSDGAV
mmetsp:Transcript_62869/g.99810  ORF Transcript_62869/g.99810 Transcript_62869/m.99810 type:complete len:81 (-) Transcript_62869:46-288(-)